MFHQADWQVPETCGANNCIEIAREGDWVGVRDGKEGAASPVLVFSIAEWAAFLTAAKSGQFDATVT
jgi:hypothetical protein